MANSQADGKRRVRRHRSHSELKDEKKHRSRGKGKVTLEPDESEVGRIRIERLETRTSTDRTAATPKMTSESYATLPTQKSSSSHRRRRVHHRSGEENSHRRRRNSTSEDDSTHVYRNPESRSKQSRIQVAEKQVQSDEGSSESEREERQMQAESVKERPRKRKIKIVYITEEDYQSTKPKERKVREKKPRDDHQEREGSIRRSKTHHSRQKVSAEALHASPPKRSTSTREPPSTSPSSLRRSHTTSSHIPSVKQYAPSLTTTNTTKRASFLGGFFTPAPQPHREPERLVECLTCLSDDIPRSKSAKLKCGHRMCHSCLKRIFKLSVTDPQHMPPKCCTADHIPLKHVEKLFDINFKKTWNHKFQEYSTKNRIYCPARRCGEWIKPGSMHREDGKKFGKCSRCKTKVCCSCNGRWHGSRDCPNDEETNKLLETAKQAGWQRCYNCRTMVELKEGCNHMTCHCTAEFCMICGLKWKSCNCPWFNYDVVEADRLQHMRVPEPARNEEAPPPPHRLQRPRRPRPNTYHEEINDRRRQERLDEEMARRLQAVSIGDDDDYQGGIGDIHGIGNGADHFMNQDYIRAAHNILTGTFDQATAAANYVMGVAQARGAPQPPPPPPGPRRMAGRYPVPVRAPSPPLLRPNSTREEAYNSAPSTRPPERIVPRRPRTDYESEAALHASVGNTPQRSVSSRTPRVSVLAGLGGRGNNRVHAWRTHVEPGVTPEEGMLSVV
ncbi:E3 ubiquitin-protein ligase itt1 [Lachnellula arida]|uniref:RBR-type E3 ubiquitin transferase n=1 Tax=Lachnellula arida TaxID=1316785 RepID=A0A8T9B839_9HELO|nr:E3 ubiquitin-protein ligase itt1 [Lachnellula arida]